MVTAPGVGALILCAAHLFQMARCNSPEVTKLHAFQKGACNTVFAAEQWSGELIMSFLDKEAGGKAFFTQQLPHLLVDLILLESIFSREETEVLRLESSLEILHIEGQLERLETACTDDAADRRFATRSTLAFRRYYEFVAGSLEALLLRLSYRPVGDSGLPGFEDALAMDADALAECLDNSRFVRVAISDPVPAHMAGVMDLIVGTYRRFSEKVDVAASEIAHLRRTIGDIDRRIESYAREPERLVEYRGTTIAAREAARRLARERGAVERGIETLDKTICSVIESSSRSKHASFLHPGFHRALREKFHELLSDEMRPRLMLRSGTGSMDVLRPQMMKNIKALIGHVRERARLGSDAEALFGADTRFMADFKASGLAALHNLIVVHGSAIKKRVDALVARGRGRTGRQLVAIEV